MPVRSLCKIRARELNLQELCQVRHACKNRAKVGLCKNRAAHDWHEFCKVSLAWVLHYYCKGRARRSDLQESCQPSFAWILQAHT